MKYSLSRIKGFSIMGLFRAIGIALIPLVILACADDGYRRTSVMGMVKIPYPDSLKDSSECRELWDIFARANLDLDKFGKNWNEIAIDAVVKLIDSGCSNSRED